MAKKVCGLGFDCAAMMQCIGIDPGDCLNYRTCGRTTELTEDEQFELVRVRQEARRRWLDEQVRFREDELERIQSTRRQAAAAMLMRRGCPQTAESMGLVDLVQRLSRQVTQIEEILQQADHQYIAPLACEVHTYSVKRPSRVELREQEIPEAEIRQHQREFSYHKLAAAQEIFEPVSGQRYNQQTREWEECRKVKALHLSHESDPRYIEARAGVERRNNLMHLRTALAKALEVLAAALQTYRDAMPSPLPYNSNFQAWLRNEDEQPDMVEVDDETLH